jgi:hypothetical protein
MNSLLLLPGEEVVWQGQGSYDAGSLSSSWKLGILYLTNKRLLLAQARRAIFETALGEIKEVKVELRRWLLGRKVKQLCLLTRGGRVFIAIKDAQLWEELIKDRITLSLAYTREIG